MTGTGRWSSRVVMLVFSMTIRYDWRFNNMDWLDKVLEYFNYIVGFLGGGICYWLGGYDQALEILLAMVVVDYLTGLLSAYVLQEIDSVIGKKGVAQKVGMFLTVAIAHLTDQILASGGMIRLMAIWFYISKEGISALENLGQVGVPIPEFLKKSLIQLKDKKNY